MLVVQMKGQTVVDLTQDTFVTIETNLIHPIIEALQNKAFLLPSLPLIQNLLS